MITDFSSTQDAHLSSSGVDVKELSKLNNQYLRYTQDSIPFFKHSNKDLAIYLNQAFSTTFIDKLINDDQSEILHILAFNNFVSKRGMRRIISYHYAKSNWGVLFICLRNTKNVKIANELGFLTQFVERFVNYLGLYVFTEEFHTLSGPAFTSYHSFLSYLYKIPNMMPSEIRTIEGLLSRESLIVLLRTGFHALVNNEISIKNSNISYFMQNYYEELEDYSTYLKNRQRFKPSSLGASQTHQCNQVALFHLSEQLNLKLKNTFSFSSPNIFPEFVIEYKFLPLNLKQDPNILNELIFHNPLMGLEMVQDTHFIESLSFSQLKSLCTQTPLGRILGEYLGAKGEIMHLNKFDILSALEHANELPSEIKPYLLEELISHELNSGILFPLYPKILAKLNYLYLAQLDRMHSFQAKESLRRTLFDGIHKDLNFPQSLRPLYFPIFLTEAQVQLYPYQESSRNFKITFEKYLGNLNFELNDFMNLSTGSDLTYAQSIEILSLL